MKPLAIYLPQFHEVPENNEWWGPGYTEWNTVRNAKPLYKGHYQPQIPENNNYYDLGEEDAYTWAWQAKLAKDAGIYGFCIYHYWFKDGKKMLYKPMEILLRHKEIDIKYCICWANEPWRRTWYGGNSELLIEQEYGHEKEWEQHFNYLLQFFMDKRYICVNKKPVVVIYRTAAIEDLSGMISKWNELAIRNGFSGIYLVSERTAFTLDERVELFDAYMNFEPAYTMHYGETKLDYIKRGIYRYTHRIYNSLFHAKSLENAINMNSIYKRMNWQNGFKDKKVYPGICPRWDNTPRKQQKGVVFKNASPELFQRKLIEIREAVEEEDFLFINAWNEWGEGAYLEPDDRFGLKYLEAIQKAMKDE